MATAPGRPSPPKPPKKEADRAKEDALLQKASAIRAVWKTLATAFSPQPEEPPRSKAHWDFVLQEGAWMAHDVMQERMWKHAAACALAHAAACFDKRTLKPTKTHVCPSVERTANEFGRVKQDGKPLFPPSVSNAKSAMPEAPVKAEQPPLSPLFFTCADGLADTLTEVLEEEDVMRLACHVEAQLAYQATVVAARRAQPMPAFAEEDLQQLGKRKRKAKPSGAGMPGTEDEYEGGGVSPMVGARAPQRRTAGSMAPARGSLADMGDEVAAPSGRDRRKRKPRDVFGDDEFEVPGKPPEAAPCPRGSRQGGPDNRRSNKAANLDARRNKASLQPMQGARISMPGAIPPGHAGATAAGMLPRPGPWNPQDDQLLVAIVTEFSPNWHLVADVLRSASCMSGVFRRWDACKARHSVLVKLQEAEQAQHPDPTQPVQSPLLMSKSQAKEVVNASLPVPENVLRAHQVIVLNLAARLKQRKTTERQQTQLTHRVPVPEHPTHLKVQQAVLDSCGGRFGTPVEIGTVADPTAQQAAAVLQQQQQQQAAAAAAAAALQQQQAAAAAAQAHAAAVSAAPFAAASSPAPPTSMALPPTAATDPLAAAQAQQAAATAAASAAAASQPGAAALPGAAVGGLPVAPPGLPPTAAGPRPSASTTPEPPPGLAAAMGGPAATAHAHAQQAAAKGAGAGGSQDDLMGSAATTPLPQLQAQAATAQAAAAANPTPEMKAQAQVAAAVLAAAQAQAQAQAQAPRGHALPSPSAAAQQQAAQAQAQAQAQQAGANSNSAAAALAAATAAALPGMAGMGMQGMQGMPSAAGAPPGMGAAAGAGGMPPQQGLPGVPDAATAAAVSSAFPVGMMGGTPQQQQQAMQAQFAQAMQAQFAQQAQAQAQPSGKQGVGGMNNQVQLALKQQQAQAQQQGMGNGGASRNLPGMGGLAGGPAAAAHGGMQGMPPASMAQQPGSSAPLTPQQLQLQMQLQQAWQGMPGMPQLPPFPLPQFGAPQPRPPI